MMEAKAGHSELCASAGGSGFALEVADQISGAVVREDSFTTLNQKPKYALLYFQIQEIFLGLILKTRHHLHHRVIVAFPPVVHMFRLLLLQETWYGGSKSRYNSSTNVTYSHCLKVCVSEHIWCMSTPRLHEEKQRLSSDQIFHIDVWLQVCFSELRFLGLQIWPFLRQSFMVWPMHR